MFAFSRSSLRKIGSSCLIAVRMIYTAERLGLIHNPKGTALRTFGCARLCISDWRGQERNQGSRALYVSANDSQAVSANIFTVTFGTSALRVICTKSVRIALTHYSADGTASMSTTI